MEKRMTRAEFEAQIDSLITDNQADMDVMAMTYISFIDIVASIKAKGGDEFEGLPLDGWVFAKDQIYNSAVRTFGKAQFDETLKDEIEFRKTPEGKAEGLVNRAELLARIKGKSKSKVPLILGLGLLGIGIWGLFKLLGPKKAKK